MQLFILLSYGFFCLLLFFNWWQWNEFQPKNNIALNRKISVIIPVRNEAQNILSLLQCLEKQTIDKSLFEVIIANDSSTDNTQEIVENFIEQSSISLRIIKLKEGDHYDSPKKRAIKHCIEQAKGEIIITTDGDSTMREKWLESIARFFEQTQAVFISAPVFFDHYNGSSFLQKLWTKMQQIEFASLIISGAVSIKSGYPNMCSGANIAYLKSAFYDVGGFSGNEAIASGDDEFLMHEMAKKHPNGVQYLKSREAIVYTNALPNWRSFYQQRIRWASKWPYYKTLSPKLMAFFIFICNATFIFSVFKGDQMAIQLKMWPEFFFLALSLSYFKKWKEIPLIPLVQLIYPFYVIFFGLSSLRKRSYIWKGRSLK